MKDKLNVSVRWAIRRDVPDILAIEAGTPDPWDEDELLRQLSRRDRISLVAELADQVVGHIVYTLRTDRYHLLRLAVLPEFRRRLVGLQLVERLVSKLNPSHRTHVTANVPDHNLGAHLFLRALGFRAVQIARHRDGDTYRFAWRLTGAKDAVAITPAEGRSWQAVPPDGEPDDFEDLFTDHGGEG